MRDKKHDQGWVYILTNPSFREDWVKIGKSSRPVDVRSKELDNTAVPLPFEIFATLKTSKYEVVERKIHKAIDRLTDLRIRQNREFFNIKPELALEILKDEAMLLDDAEIMLYKDNKPIRASQLDEEPEADRPRRASFRFSMVKVPIGATIVFVPTGIKVKVASDNQVEYEGRIYKLSPFVGTFMPAEERNASGAYQGAKYFSYNGRILDDLRHDMETCLEFGRENNSCNNAEKQHLQDVHTERPCAGGPTPEPIPHKNHRPPLGDWATYTALARAIAENNGRPGTAGGIQQKLTNFWVPGRGRYSKANSETRTMLESYGIVFDRDGFVKSCANVPFPLRRQ